MKTLLIGIALALVLPLYITLGDDGAIYQQAIKDGCNQVLEAIKPIQALKEDYVKEKEPILLGEFTITHYCPCNVCCGKTNGITASGKKATENHTIAASNQFNFGDRLIINNVVYEVEDRGGAIKGNRIDIYVNNHKTALSRGKFISKVYQIK